MAKKQTWGQWLAEAPGIAMEGILTAPFKLAQKGLKAAGGWVGSSVIPKITGTIAGGISGIHGLTMQIPIKGLKYGRKALESVLPSSVANYLYTTKTGEKSLRYPFTYRGAQRTLHYLAKEPYLAKGIRKAGEYLGSVITPEPKKYPLKESHIKTLIAPYKELKEVPKAAPQLLLLPKALPKAPILRGVLEAKASQGLAFIKQPKTQRGTKTAMSLIKWPKEEELKKAGAEAYEKAKKSWFKEPSVEWFKAREKLYKKAIEEGRKLGFTKEKTTGLYRPEFYIPPAPKESPRFAEYKTYQKEQEVISNINKLAKRKGIKKPTISSYYDSEIENKAQRKDIKNYIHTKLPKSRKVKITELFGQSPTDANVKKWRDLITLPLKKAEKIEWKTEQKQKGIEIKKPKPKKRIRYPFTFAID